VLGKKMKKGPESYKDVSGKVEKNFRKAKKEAEMEALIQKYRVEIDEEVLKTVNRCGNK
jgi:peptidyl-prolyl cis-trans isomerase SurA